MGVLASPNYIMMMIINIIIIIIVVVVVVVVIIIIIIINNFVVIGTCAAMQDERERQTGGGGDRYGQQQKNDQTQLIPTPNQLSTNDRETPWDSVGASEILRNVPVGWLQSFRGVRSILMDHPGFSWEFLAHWVHH